MEKPDLEKMEIYCGEDHHPVRMVLVRSLELFGKAIYQCTVCGSKKKVLWRAFTQQIKIEDYD